MARPFGICPARRWYALGLVLGALACSEKTDKESSPSTNTPSTVEVTTSGCPGRLEPVAAIGTTVTVGDGTPESCTEDALAAAVASLPESEASLLFDCGTKPHTITLSSELLLKGTLLIDGDSRITLSGNDSTRILNLDNYTNLTLQRITLSHGASDESGGALNHPWYGTLTAIDVLFQNNQANRTEGEIGGGAVFAGGLSEAVFSGCRFVGNAASNGGGLLNRGSTLSIVDCVFEENEATSEAESGQFGNGGGLYIDGMNYDNPGEFHLCGTTFSHNHAKQHGSAVFSYFYEGSTSYVDRCLFEGNDFEGSKSGGAGGFYHEAVALFLSNSTFEGNTSLKHAAGLFIGSGSSATITNTTFAKNIVPEVGAAIFNGASSIRLVNCTLAGNRADYAPAIFKGESATVELQNTLFFNNGTDNEYSALACTESLTDGGGNLQWPETKASGSADVPCVSGILFADPKLGELDDSAFPPVMRPGSGSPALELGKDCPETDALGVERAQSCDSGAVEGS